MTTISALSSGSPPSPGVMKRMAPSMMPAKPASAAAMAKAIAYMPLDADAAEFGEFAVLCDGANGAAGPGEAQEGPEAEHQQRCDAR